MSAESLVTIHEVSLPGVAEPNSVTDGFDVWWQLEGSGAVVRATGELDLATGPRFARALIEAATHSPGNVIVDFTAVRFFDAGTLGLLVATAAVMRKHGNRILLRGLTPFQKTLVRSCKLNHVLLVG